jgi:hypothetical protein
MLYIIHRRLLIFLRFHSLQDWIHVEGLHAHLQFRWRRATWNDIIIFLPISNGIQLRLAFFHSDWYALMGSLHLLVEVSSSAYKSVRARLSNTGLPAFFRVTRRCNWVPLKCVRSNNVYCRKSTETSRSKYLSLLHSWVDQVCMVAKKFITSYYVGSTHHALYIHGILIIYLHLLIFLRKGKV